MGDVLTFDVQLRVEGTALKLEKAGALSLSLPPPPR